MSERFTDSGMWKIPTRVEEVEDTEDNLQEITITAAFCSNGHSLLDNEHTFHGKPGIKMAFVRPNGEEGLFVVSSKLNDTEKVAIKGEIVNGEKVVLKCPECGTEFPILAPCDRCHTGEMVAIFSSQDLNMENSFSFCDLFGCPNAMMIHSDKIIRAIKRDSF